jgi:hypothetical protein
MSIYTLLLIGIGLLAILFLMGFFFFIQWLDNKIDRKERLGANSKWEKIQKEKEEELRRKQS